ncbi:MAG TPA: XdhC/CoxI family protein [Thermoanaerobaculia bacterium]|nr:XdhC/CoxI family protein [Thermoanaerobaculia bacterium]
MNDIKAAVEAWQQKGEAVAVATVVGTVGSSPRRVGAKMAVSESGRLAGSVSGGCVEGAVVEEARRVLRGGGARLLSFGVADEDAWAVGLSCGGTIEVFVEPWERPEDPAVPRQQIVRRLARCLEEELPVAVATVVSGSGVGNKLLADASGVTAGSLGSVELDGLASEHATAHLTSGRSEVVELAGSKVFIEVHLPPPRLIIIGAVHIAISLTRLAGELGFRVVVIDARSDFATPDRFREAHELIVGWPDEVLSKIRLDERSHVVVMTHDPKLDNPALVAALRSRAPYVGALGSRKTHERRVALLLAAGLSSEEIGRIHAPIGLDIGARTPEEIALAIMTQIVAVRNGRGAR